jgi:hypothetical protein
MMLFKEPPAFALTDPAEKRRRDDTPRTNRIHTNILSRVFYRGRAGEIYHARPCRIVGSEHLVRRESWDTEAVFMITPPPCATISGSAKRIR